MFIKIMYSMLVVSDQDRAVEFYTKLGLEKRIDFPGPDGRFLTMGFKGQDVELMLWKGVPMTSSDNSESSIDRNPGMVFIESKDLKEDFNTLVSKGMKFIESAPVDYPFGIRLTVVDPDGNRIALRQRK
jgi:predicted enzyme related to lactoylglutathione lyase